MQVITKLTNLWQDKKGKWAIIGGIIVLLFLLPVRCDGPYRGRVVSKESGEPLAGVVVVASWSHMIPNVGGGSTRCLDAAEALTDENGEFAINARWAALFRPLGTMHIAIYKVGYKKVQCMWKALAREGSCYAFKPVELDGDRAVFPLEKISKAQLASPKGDPPYISCGPKNGEPLTEYRNARREFQRAIEKRP